MTVLVRPDERGPGTPAGRMTLLDFARAHDLRLLALGPSKDPNAKVTVLLVPEGGRRPVYAVKAPTTDGAARAVETERAFLRALEARLDETLALRVPRVVDLVDVDGRTGVVATALPGTPMTTLYLQWRHVASPARVAADFEAVGSWLARFQSATACGRGPVEPDAGVTAGLARRFGEDPALADDLEALAAIHGRLREHAAPRTAVHGDLWMGNVLITGGEVTGVVDWEAASPLGEPVRDLVRFALVYALYLDRRTRPGRRVPGHPGLRAGGFGAGLRHALEGSGWFTEHFRGFLGDGLERLGVPRAAWRDAVLAGVAEMAALTDDPGFAHQQLELFRGLVAGRRTP